MALCHHVFRPFEIVFNLDFLHQAPDVHLMETIEPYGPLTLRYEVYLGHIDLFFIEIAILCIIFEAAWHKAKCDLIQEVGIELFAHFEKGTKCVTLNNVHEEELAHDVLLDFEGDRVKILFAC